MKHIVIVGGGTSGWLTAAYLASKLSGSQQQPLQFSLVESADIPIIGVGEATTPSIRATLADIGFDENDFIRLCDASFKHGILFKHWLNNKVNDPQNAYFHPFERPLRAGTDGLEDYWLKGFDPLKRAFQDAVSIQHQVAIKGLAPKTLQDRPYDAPLPYAYHLDAGKLASALKQAGIQRGVKHIIGTVSQVTADQQTGIQRLDLESGESISGDLFIDCSGFRGLLINQLAQASDWQDCSNVLFCDSAVTLQLPYQAEEAIRPFTTATAKAHGWIWDIGLTSRRGVGYVYSSHYTDKHDAERELLEYAGIHQVQKAPRHLQFNTGYRLTPWFKNCVAVGLSGGFLEPLESTGIHLVEQAVWALASMLPKYFNQAPCHAGFNHFMAEHYRHAINFVKYHYLLSERTDSDFWLNNANSSSWTPWLQEKVALWQQGFPDIYDMQNLHTIFDHASYQYVYFGMQKKPTLGAIGGKRSEFAQQIFKRVSDGINNAQKRLPNHNQILTMINDNGVQKVKFNSQLHARTTSSIRNIPSNYKAGI